MTRHDKTSDMTPERIEETLTWAIRKRHAVTLSLDHHHAMLIEPQSLTWIHGNRVLIYWNADNERIEKHQTSLITEVVDLERSLDDLRPEQADRPHQPPGPGRPRQRTEPTRVVSVEIAASIADALDAATNNKTAYIEQMLRERLMGESSDE